MSRTPHCQSSSSHRPHTLRQAGGLFLVAMLVQPVVMLGQDPGCPPSFCPAADGMHPDAISRLTLFPGTANVVHDNGPGDLDPKCGVLRVQDQYFPGPPYSNGFGVFSGTLIFEAPDASTPGELRVTDAEIRTGSPSGQSGSFSVIAGQELPFACGEFLWNQGMVPAFLTNSIDAVLLTSEDMLAGAEEFGFTAVARTFTTSSPPPVQPPPTQLFVEVIAPSSPGPGPVYLSSSATNSGYYTKGLGVIGLRMEGINLPEGEIFRLPHSIEVEIGEEMVFADAFESGGTSAWTLPMPVDP